MQISYNPLSIHYNGNENTKFRTDNGIFTQKMHCLALICFEN